jgi:hypothetical protein
MSDDKNTIAKGNAYVYAGNFYQKPEDKIRKHLQDALNVAGLDGSVSEKAVNFLCANNLILEIVKVHAIPIYVRDGKLYLSEEDAMKAE